MRRWCVLGAWLMDDKFKAILDSIPKKHERSKLEPYTGLIEQLRRRGHTYREIARILAEKCDLVVASSTLVRFVFFWKRQQSTEQTRTRQNARQARDKRWTKIGQVFVNFRTLSPT